VDEEEWGVYKRDTRIVWRRRSGIGDAPEAATDLRCIPSPAKHSHSFLKKVCIGKGDEPERRRTGRAGFPWGHTISSLRIF